MTCAYNSNSQHWTFLGQSRLDLCNQVSIWAVITNEQIHVPTGSASKHTMYCTLSVSSAALQKIQPRKLNQRIISMMKN